MIVLKPGLKENEVAASIAKQPKIGREDPILVIGGGEEVRPGETHQQFHEQNGLSIETKAL